MNTIENEKIYIICPLKTAIFYGKKYLRPNSFNSEKETSAEIHLGWGFGDWRWSSWSESVVRVLSITKNKGHEKDNKKVQML